MGENGDIPWDLTVIIIDNCADFPSSKLCFLYNKFDSILFYVQLVECIVTRLKLCSLSGSIVYLAHTKSHHGSIVQRLKCEINISPFTYTKIFTSISAAAIIYFHLVGYTVRIYMDWGHFYAYIHYIHHVFDLCDQFLSKQHYIDELFSLMKFWVSCYTASAFDIKGIELDAEYLQFGSFICRFWQFYYGDSSRLNKSGQFIRISLIFPVIIFEMSHFLMIFPFSYVNHIWNCQHIASLSMFSKSIREIVAESSKNQEYECIHNHPTNKKTSVTQTTKATTTKKNNEQESEFVP